FAAGGGNEVLLAQAGLTHWPHRRRPLHQLMLGGVEQPLYAHCVGKNPKPLATVTTHPTPSGEGIWYVGGLMAEDGVGESSERLIEHARRKLPELFPAVNFKSARWATFRVDRAEGIASSVRHLGGPIFSEKNEFLAVWPTKLALAPALAERVRQRFVEQGLKPRPNDLQALEHWERPEVARPPWEEAKWID
ncbi:FAD-dependent oxidoreductase, partial [Myxococcota bacterium]|nr:FAD-dependent oxidoreductase [Myxococcota bacterium]